MRKISLISQLLCMSVLFASEGDNHLHSGSVSRSHVNWDVDINLGSGRNYDQEEVPTPYICMSNLDKQMKLYVQLNDRNTLEEILNQENLAKGGYACELIENKIKRLLIDVTDFSSNDEYVKVPEALEKLVFSYEGKEMLKQIGDNVSVKIRGSLCEALINKLSSSGAGGLTSGYQLHASQVLILKDMPFIHWYDCKFKTEIVDGCSYTVAVIAGSGLGNRLKLSDLVDKRAIYPMASVHAPAPGKFMRSSGDTEFGYKVGRIPGNDLDNMLLIALEKAAELRDDTIDQLSKIESIEFPLARVFRHQYDHHGYLCIIPSDQGKKLHPKWTGESESVCLQIRMNHRDTVDKFLTEEKLLKYRSLSDLITTNIHTLLAGVTKFTDTGGYSSIPDSLKNQAFWPQAEILLKQIDNTAEVNIPAYQLDALVAKRN